MKDPIKSQKKYPNRCIWLKSILPFLAKHIYYRYRKLIHTPSKHNQDPVIQNRCFLNVFVCIALTEMRRRRKALVVLVIRRLLTCAICIIALLGFLTVHIYVAPLNRLPRLHLNKHTSGVRNQSLFSSRRFRYFFKRMIGFVTRRE